MFRRFIGDENRHKRISAFNEQFIINGNQRFAEYFADRCEVLGVEKGAKIIEQDGIDNDLYFLVAGSVEINVNNRTVAVREKQMHVGEMALLDDTAKRSASVVAAEELVVFKVKQDEFERFADQNPILWRRIAVELSNRLRERSKFVRIPNAKPMIFLGSSTEALPKAKLVKDVLVGCGLNVKSWDDSELFALSENTLDELIEILAAYDFALFYVSGDDKLESRGKTSAQPRDNVILEAGMSIGALGKCRTFLLVEADSRPGLPSDLKGVTYLPMRFDGANLCAETLTQISDKIVARISEDGVK